MKIVKFKDGKYGIRKFTMIGYQFLGLEKANYWWLLKSCVQEYCKGTLKEAKEAYSKIKQLEDIGRPIKCQMK